VLIAKARRVRSLFRRVTGASSTQLSNSSPAAARRQSRRDDHQMTVYVNRQDMTAPNATFATLTSPERDIIRYNRASKVYDVKVADYALVTGKDHQKNESDGSLRKRTRTHLQPATPFRCERLSRSAARIRGRRPPFNSALPFTEKRIANGELATIAKIVMRKCQ